MAFTNVRQLKRTVKVLFIGPTGVGKTYPMFQLEGRLAVFDGEDGTKAFADKFDFDVDFFDTFKDLTSKVDAFLSNPEALAQYNTIGFDGMTVAWHSAIREQEDDEGRIGFSKQAQLKGHGKLFMDQIMRLGKRGKNVVANAQAKPEWDTTDPKRPKLLGMKGDIDERVYHAFDLVLFLDMLKSGQGGRNVRVASVLKSRYPSLFRVGDTIEEFDAAVHFKPIFDGTAQYVEEQDGTAAEIERARQQIKTVVRELKGVSRGGVIPDDDAKRLWGIAERSTSLDELGAALEEARSFKKPAAATA